MSSTIRPPTTPGLPTVAPRTRTSSALQVSVAAKASTQSTQTSRPAPADGFVQTSRKGGPNLEGGQPRSLATTAGELSKRYTDMAQQLVDKFAQKGKDDCATSVVCMLQHLLPGGTRNTDAAFVKRILGDINTERGITAGMLGRMLGQAGMRVAGVKKNIDVDMLDKNLAAGRPVIAQVDAGLIQPNGKLQDRPHFVTLIGKDPKGNYLVLNPDKNAKDRYYAVSAEQLKQAEQAVTGGGGGLIAVERYTGSMDLDKLARSNSYRSMALGNRKGGGSRDKIFIEP